MPSVKKKLLLSTFTCSIGFLALFLLGETAVRLHRGTLFTWKSARETRLDMLRSAYPVTYDTVLGYVPTPGYKSVRNYWGTRVSIGPSGLRSNGQQVPVHGDAILVVGDSYTFGDEVNDEETWPAYLESNLGRPVLNGGVFGYGLDQIVLRAEQLLKEHRAAVLVVSIIPDDIQRCQFSYRFASKPYFEIVNNSLQLQNVPVPTPGQRPISFLLTMLGYSNLADAILSRVCPELWIVDPSGIKVVHHGGKELACLLMERLASLAKKTPVRLLLVMQGYPDHQTAEAEPVLTRAQQLGIEVLDLLPALSDSVKAEPAKRQAWFTPQWHMTAEGNAWVAKRIAEKLHAMNWITLGATPLRGEVH
jgi:hypothetical protein